MAYSNEANLKRDRGTDHENFSNSKEWNSLIRLEVAWPPCYFQAWGLPTDATDPREEGKEPLIQPL